MELNKTESAHGAANIITRIIMWLFIVFIGVLFVSSLLSTAELSYSEKVTLRFESPLAVLITAAVYGCFIFIFCRCGLPARINTVKLLRIFLLYSLVLAVLWVLAAKSEPRADQLSMLQAAAEVNSGDYSTFAPGGYMYMYPHQLSYLLYTQLLLKLFGSGNYMAFKLLNCVYLTGMWYILYEIARILFADERSVKVFILLCFGALVPVLYCGFIYSEFIYMLFSLLSILYLLKFISGRKPGHFALCCLFIALAVLARNTALILAVASAVVLALEALKGRALKNILCVFIILALCFTVTPALKSGYGRLTGRELADGRPMSVWFAIGLYDGELAAGWYDDFSIDIYNNTGWNTYLTDIEAKKMIRAALSGFYHDPAYAVDFLYRKFATQWNEPTYAAFYVNYSAAAAQDQFISGFFTGTANRVLNFHLNAYHLAVCAGTFIYCLLNRKKTDTCRLLIPLFIFGGFLFSMIWEAKSRYVLLYVILMLPYAAAGLMSAADACRRRLEKTNERQR